jgi:membrane protein YdbS with pleckstrin-like domain
MNHPHLPMSDIELRYNKGVFLPPLILLLVGMVFLNLFVSLSFGFDIISALVAALVSAVLVLTVGVSPIMTNHTLNESELVLRQGWLFRSVIPTEEIKSINVLERGPRRTGVFFDFKGTSLYVTTQRHNLIRLTLKNPRRFNWALWKRTDQIIFDSLDQRVFLKAMESKAEITPASPAR